MLKQMLLIGAAAVSFPVIAQTTAPAVDPAAPTTATEPATMPDSTMPTEPAPAPAPDASAPAPAASSPPAATEPAPAGAAASATPTQIAQIVDKEFPTYDADANGDLNNAEFATWMKKLRAATEPGVDPESAEVKTWIGQAFAAADGDKSGAVNKSELTGFLTRGA
ncbi:calcium-binding protein [Sphingopyxis sp.]|jgi:hypothetical protein|uniref:calcium-binding protein n=1 Tax=Sphingopyxis sp. TaxID=1908224 RepID=UPI0025E8B059|nr:calcium-binding protein [Sphingopyxis sp.]MBK6414224.1 calcium-binding protein [Sphingopyxis sp.]